MTSDENAVNTSLYACGRASMRASISSEAIHVSPLPLSVAVPFWLSGLSVSIDRFEEEGGLIAAARIDVLARHVGERFVTLVLSLEPMGALPVRADEACERVAWFEPDANAEGARRFEVA